MSVKKKRVLSPIQKQKNNHIILRLRSSLKEDEIVKTIAVNEI